MATVGDQIMDAVVAALTQAGPVNGTSKPSGLTTDRFPLRHVTTADLPHQTVVRVRNDSGTRGSASLDHEVRLRIQTKVQITDGSAADVVCDTALAWNHAALMEDHTLGGLAHDIKPSTVQWTAVEEADAYAEMWQEYLIEYETSRTDLEA